MREPPVVPCLVVATEMQVCLLVHAGCTLGWLLLARCSGECMVIIIMGCIIIICMGCNLVGCQVEGIQLGQPKLPLLVIFYFRCPYLIFVSYMLFSLPIFYFRFLYFIFVSYILFSFPICYFRFLYSIFAAHMLFWLTIFYFRVPRFRMVGNNVVCLRSYVDIVV